jgi:hypothetical protein
MAGRRCGENGGKKYLASKIEASSRSTETTILTGTILNSQARSKARLMVNNDRSSGID